MNTDYLWQDEGRRKALYDALQSPVLQLAFSYIRDKIGKPKANQAATADALLTQGALEQSRLYGVHEALDMFELLVNIKPKNEAKLPEPFSHIDEEFEKTYFPKQTPTKPTV